MGNMISVAHSTDDVFVHVPPRLNVAYLEDVLSKKLERGVTVSDCTATNLCAHNWGGVSNSGATVLRLALDLAHGEHIDLVAKLLSPDVVNTRQHSVLAVNSAGQYNDH